MEQIAASLQNKNLRYEVNKSNSNYYYYVNYPTDSSAHS